MDSIKELKEKSEAAEKDLEKQRLQLLQSLGDLEKKKLSYQVWALGRAQAMGKSERKKRRSILTAIGIVAALVTVIVAIINIVAGAVLALCIIIAYLLLGNQGQEKRKMKNMMQQQFVSKYSRPDTEWDAGGQESIDSVS